MASIQKKMPEKTKRAICMAVPTDAPLSAVFIKRKLEEIGIALSSASVSNACMRLEAKGYLVSSRVGRYVHYQRIKDYPEPEPEKYGPSDYIAEDGMRVSLPPAPWDMVA